MSTSFPPPSHVTRAQYGDLTYDREFHAEKHNAEYKTNLTTETECRITYNTLEGRAVLYHGAGGEKHPADAAGLADWINQKAVCPTCSLNLDAKPFLKPFPLLIEARVKTAEVASRIALTSSVISFGMLLVSGAPLSSFILLGVPTALVLASYITTKAIRERRWPPMNFELNSAAGIAVFAASLLAVSIPAVAMDTGFAEPIAKTMALASTGIGIVANAVKGYFGW